MFMSFIFLLFYLLGKYGYCQVLRQGFYNDEHYNVPLFVTKFNKITQFFMEAKHPKSPRSLSCWAMESLGLYILFHQSASLSKSLHCRLSISFRGLLEVTIVIGCNSACMVSNFFKHISSHKITSLVFPAHIYSLSLTHWASWQVNQRLKRNTKLKSLREQYNNNILENPMTSSDTL